MGAMSCDLGKQSVWMCLWRAGTMCRVDASQAPRFLGLGWKISLGFQAQEETGLEAAQVPQVESEISMGSLIT